MSKKKKKIEDYESPSLTDNSIKDNVELEDGKDEKRRRLRSDSTAFCFKSQSL